MTILKALTLLCLAASSATAQDRSAQQLISDRYIEPDARTAYDALDARWEAAEAIQFADVVQLGGDWADYVPKHPLLQNITWPYETCIDVVSFVPPPQDGWAIQTQVSSTSNPIKDDVAEARYIEYGQG